MTAFVFLLIGIFNAVIAMVVIKATQDMNAMAWTLVFLAAIEAMIVETVKD